MKKDFNNLRSKQKGFILNPFINKAAGGIINEFGNNTVLQLDGYGQDFLSPIVDSSSYNRLPLSYGRTYISKKKYISGKSSLYLSGVDPLTYVANADFNFNIDKWTVETYFYLTGMNTGNAICSRRNSTTTNPYGLALTVNGIRGMFNGVWSDTQLTWAYPTSMVWHHIRYVKNFTTIYVFLDGVLVGTKLNVNTIFDPAVTFSIGSTMSSIENSSRMFIQHFRFIKNEALSITDFIPTPYATIDNTVYDSDFDDQGRDKLLKLAHLQILGDGTTLEDSSPMGCTITLGGTTLPSISTVRSKWGTKSIYMPLGSSIISTSPASKYAFNFIGDYEISKYVYFESLPATDSGFINISSSEAVGRLSLIRTTTGGFYLNRYGESNSGTFGSAPINQWFHFVFGKIDGQYYISIAGRIYYFSKESYAQDGNGSGRIILYAGGSNTYFNSIRILPFRDNFDSIAPADFTPHQTELSKVPIPDGYDPLFQRNIFLCKFDTFSGNLDLSKRNLPVNYPPGSLITVGAGTFGNGITKTVTAPNAYEGITITMPRVLAYENWTFETVLSFSSFGSADCRIAVVGVGTGYPIYLQVSAGGVPYLSASSGSFQNTTTTLALNTKYKFTIIKVGGWFHFYNSGVFMYTCKVALITSGSDKMILFGGTNAVGSVWTVDDTRFTLGNRYSYVTDNHATEFLTQ